MKDFPTFHVYGPHKKHVEWEAPGIDALDMDAMMITDIERHIEVGEGSPRVRVTFVARLVEHEDETL
jgi:hypothetical protein